LMRNSINGENWRVIFPISSSAILNGITVRATDENHNH
jgi:hypothetical protein